MKYFKVLRYTAMVIMTILLSPLVVVTMIEDFKWHERIDNLKEAVNLLRRPSGS